MRFAVLFVLCTAVLLAGCLNGSQPSATPVASQGTPTVSAQATASAPTATVEPSVESTMQAEGSAKLLSVNAYRDGKFLMVFGEVENDGSVPIGSLEVKVSYTDKNGKPKSVTKIPRINYLEPGWKAPFDFVTDNAGSDEVTAEIERFKAAEKRYQGLQITESKGEPVDAYYGGYYKITGKVENTGSEPSDFVWIVATFYDADGKVVEDGVNAIASSGGSIPPGFKGTFQIVVAEPPHTEIAKAITAVDYD